MMNPEAKLKALGITLPEVTPPAAVFVPFVRTGSLLFVSGHIAKREGKPWSGQLGAQISLEEGKQAARAAAIDLIATLRVAVGELSKVKRIVKLLVMVSSASGFTEQHLVANGASELFMEIFGDGGKHARSAVGMAQLPLGACVEIELVAEIA
jgi:enamine deaminase RidA (YjgF/YER057c/UK114 family)